MKARNVVKLNKCMYQAKCEIKIIIVVMREIAQMKEAKRS
jgi:hypothetical protein